MTVTPVAIPATTADVEPLLRRAGGFPIAIRLPGHFLAELDPATMEGLSRAPWTFLVGGWSSPVLASLPAGSRRLQIEKELDALRSAGATRFAGYVDIGWEPGLVDVFLATGLPDVFLTWPAPHPLRPVITDHLGEVVVVFPVGSPICPIFTTDTRLEGEAISPDLLRAAGTVGRSEPATDRTWMARLEADPEGALLYRKMLRLASRLPERLPPEAAEWLMLAQAGHWFREPDDRSAAHHALATARHRLDLARRRSSEWVRLSRLDWDADGADEHQVETADLSLVVDHAACSVLYVDHKSAERTVSYLPGEPSWHLARVLAGDRPAWLQAKLVEAVAEKESAKVAMAADGLDIEVWVTGGELSLAYRPKPGFAYDLVGPEISLAFEGPVTLRVDGGDWQETSQALAVSGHRFRLSDGRHQVLLSMDQPGALFSRPAVGGTVLWLNWQPTGTDYRVLVRFER
ncbi:MAG: hypothetical protein ACT4OP_04790 [Actinomycetota bacterium]